MVQAAAVLEREVAHTGKPVADSGLTGLLLPAPVQEIVTGMLQIVSREGKGVQQRIEIYRTIASDEIEAQLVISVQTELSVTDAFALWDRIGDAVQAWTTALPKPQEDIALDIAVEVLWSVDHAAR